MYVLPITSPITVASPTFPNALGSLAYCWVFWLPVKRSSSVNKYLKDLLKLHRVNIAKSKTFEG
jgi:hypothetical protein